jgi:ABC-type transporter Mla maintaining outer membrane lipid asymmetry permease subunit MlaE
MKSIMKALVMGLVIAPVALFSGCACKPQATTETDAQHAVTHSKHKLHKMKHEHGGK